MSTLDGKQLGPSKSFSVESPRNGNDFDEPVVIKPVESSERTDVAFTTSRRELWAFYLYYVVRKVQRFPPGWLTRLQGNNGLSGFNFGPSQFQNLLYLAGYDPAYPPYSTPCGSGTGCVLPYLGRIRDSVYHIQVVNTGSSPLTAP